MNALFRTTPRLLTLLASLVLLGPSVRAKDKDNDEAGKSTARVQFSDPAKPGTLKLSLPWAEARITATDGKEVIVTSTLDQKGRKEVDSEGFRRIDEDVSFEVVEKNNVATITIAGDNQWAAQGAEFDIKVPRNTNIDVSVFSASVTVEGVEGSHKVHTFSSRVRLDDVTGPIQAHSFSGSFTIRAKAWQPDQSIDIDTFSGSVELHLPESARGRVTFNSFSGHLNSEMPLTLHSSNRRSLSADLGSGDGGTLRFKTFSGSVKIDR